MTDRGAAPPMSTDPADRLVSAPMRLSPVDPTADRGLLGATPFPRPLTSFIGREQEIRNLLELLRRPESILLTLTGPGGVGKTRLALRVAAEVAGDFDDGVCFVQLPAVR